MRIDGEKLKKARIQRGLTEFEVSKAAKMAFEHYTGLEEYGGTIRKDAAARLALALDVLVEDIEAAAKTKPQEYENPAPQVEDECLQDRQMRSGGVKPMTPPDMPKPQLVDPVAASRNETFFVKFYQRENTEQERRELLIRSDIITYIAQDRRFPKIWIGYEVRSGITSFSETYDTQSERDQRWNDICLALINGRREFL